jgi:hypothetical protein
MVTYSTALNEVQDDVSAHASNSLFVTELLKNVGIPNQTAQQALSQARFAISATTHSEQVPWISDETPQSFSLVPTPSPR